VTAVESPLERISRLPREERDALFAEEARKHGMTPAQLKAMLAASWRFIGRPKQQPPPDDDWTFWYVLAGRGFGKTLTAAQWSKERGLDRKCRFALIAPTLRDVRATMVEGEALALDTLVQTPGGAVPIGEIRDGDLVLGGDGTPCRVVHAHPVLDGRTCYRVRLKGGAEIVADAKHHWLTEDAGTRAYNARYSHRPSRPLTVRTTEEIAETLRHFSGEASQANHGIPVSAFEAPDADLPIDPYVLGAWLGDGTSKAGAICDAEGEVVGEVERAGYEVRLQPSSGTVPVYGVLGLQRQLRETGLIRNKHVPVEYLRASSAQRLALVQGLMDTDGHATARGQCEFVSKRRELAEALVDLLCGLGIKAGAPRSKETRIGTTHWIVRFTTTTPVFRMGRKAARIPVKYRDARHWLVLSVEPTESVPVRCLTVDSPDRTYLVTRHYVRTHNTGLLSVLPAEALLGQSREYAWNRTNLELTLANGTILSGFSSEEPDRLRGPQHDYAWGEEVSSWKDARHGDQLGTTFSNMKLGLRLGAHPRACLTSTPKANKLTKELVALSGLLLRLVRGSSYENRANLSEAWWRAVVAPLEGTRTGRQEIEAELLEDVEGALWTRAMIDLLRVLDYPPLMRIVVGVDPNTTSGESADAAGIVVAGLGHSDKHGYVLEDRTQVRGGPRAWAQAAVDAFHDWEADRIVVETNNGGEMCQMVIQGVDPTVPVKMVTASRGKRTRAEPVSALYESDEEHDRVGRVHHVGSAGDFADLEDEMTTWTPADDSPNRMDALVWALTDLKIWKPPSALAGMHVPQGEMPGVVDRDADLGYSTGG